jgi:hypothetical protein
LKSLFVIDPGSLGDLDVKEGTRLIADILRCEAARIQLPAERVVISSRTSVKDGGIDAKVEDALADAALLRKGSTYLQIKTGSGFKPWSKPALIKELFGKAGAKPSKALLGKEIRRCLDKSGRYVLVTLGHDLLPTQHSEAIEHLTELFKSCGYKTPAVEVVGQGQLVTFLEQYPSLCLDLNGLGEARFQSYQSWTQNADMKTSLTLGEAQKNFIADIRSAWRGHQVQHIRVIGEPGIGKTRLILEAASSEDLSPVTVYVLHAEDFQTSSLFNELLKVDRQYTVHLVIDECEERERASIWNALKGKPHLKLITIDHGPETSTDVSMKVFECPPLPKEEIGIILASYIGTRDVSNWAEWCEGSPRVAHAVGDNLKRNPRDILKPPATVPIWDRFVLGHKKFDSKTADEHFLVLRHLALFQRFGFEEPVSEEGRFISKLVQEADPSITWQKFQSIVRHHKGRRILQGRHTLFLVPKALHVHLWVDFWNEHGLGFDFQDILSRLPDGLKHWFLRLFIYAHASPVAQAVVKKILALPTGPFADREFLTSQVGTKFLSYLAEADPDRTLGVLERTFATWPREELQKWTTGRQDIVWTLEKIVVWKVLFQRAAKVLQQLALAENAKNSNNSKGLFASLFSIGIGWAPTETPPDLRYPILESLVRSADPPERSLGLELCGEWLSTRGGMRIIGAEYQGLRPTVQFWRAATYGEMFDAWRKVWRFLEGEVKKWPEADRRGGASRLIESGADLIHYAAVADEIMDSLLRLADDPGTDKAHFIKLVIRELRLRYSKLPKGVPAKLKALDKKLTGTSFADRFGRFVLHTTWDEDYKVRGGKVEEERKSVTKVEELAGEVVKNGSTFSAHLPLFVTSEGHRLAQFGFEVSKQKDNADLDDQIFTALKSASTKATTEFIGGYLSSLRSKDLGRWETFMLKLLESAELRTVGVNAVFRSGVSEAVIRQLLNLYKSEVVTCRAFSRLGYSARQSEVKDFLVQEVIEALLARDDEGAIGVSIELMDQYYCNDKAQVSLPKDLAYRLLEAGITEREDRDGMREYYWHRIANQYRKQYPERDMELLAVMLKHFDQMSRIRRHNDASQVADEIVRKHPKDAWKLITQALEGDKKHAYEIVSWLGEMGFEDSPKAGALRLLDPQDVIDWTGDAPDKRVALMYHALPKSLDQDDGGTVTRLFIEAFSDLDKVGPALISHFMYGGGWSGPKSEYLARKRDKARKWLSETTSAKIQTWLMQYIEALSADIESAQIGEEREF